MSSGSFLGTSTNPPSPGSPPSCSETRGAALRSTGVQPERLTCELASLLPHNGLTTQDEQDKDLNLCAPLIKVEQKLDHDIEMPPFIGTETDLADTVKFPGLMESLVSDETCSDLVSTFVNDAALDAPVSFEDFLEIL